MPLYRRLPKRGFSNAPFKKEYAVLNLGFIADKFEAGEEVSKETLLAKGLLSGAEKRMPVKILAKGEFDKSLTFVNIDKFSKSAQELIEKAGGSITTK